MRLAIGRVVVMGLALLLAHVAAGSAAETAARPSIVLILSDDEDLASHRVMAQTKALIADQGAVFANYFVTYSFCCPSRTTILRGQYPHNHRIEGNELAQRRLRQVHGARARATRPSPPGCRRRLPHGVLRQADERLRARGRSAVARLGRVVRRRRQVQELRLHAERERQARGLRPSARGPSDRRARPQGRRRDPAQPTPTSRLFLSWPPTIRTARPAGAAPCRPLRRRAAAAVAVLRRGGRQPTSRPTSPTSRRSQPWQIEALTRHNRERLRALRAVDDLVATVVGRSRRPAGSTNTYVVYTSDNGFHMGQHRLFIGKTTAYEEDIRVPMAIRGPGVPKGAHAAADGAEQRPGADLRRHRRGRAAELRRRPLVPAAARQAGHALAAQLPDRAPADGDARAVAARRSSRRCAPRGTPTSSTAPASASSTTSQADPFQLDNIARPAPTRCCWRPWRHALAELKNCAARIAGCSRICRSSPMHAGGRAGRPAKADAPRDARLRNRPRRRMAGSSRTGIGAGWRRHGRGLRSRWRRPLRWPVSQATGSTMKPIVTLTVNPAIDAACVADEVVPMRKVRTRDERYDAGRRRHQRRADDPRARRRGRGLLPRRRHHRAGARRADRAQRHRRRAGADRRPDAGQPHRLRDQHRPRVPLHARRARGHRGRVAQLPGGALDRRRRLVRRQRQPGARPAARFLRQGGAPGEGARRPRWCWTARAPPCTRRWPRASIWSSRAGASSSICSAARPPRRPRRRRWRARWSTAAGPRSWR